MELGSEFNLSLTELTVKQNNIFKYLSDYTHSVYFDSGRSALRHLALFLSDEYEILMPEFICESVTNCFKNIRFYHLHDDFSVDIDDLEFTVNTKAIFLMHYFGNVQKDLDRIKALAEKHGCIVIEDTTHSIFSKTHTIGDYQICSIRKWLPIPKGGVLYTNYDRLGVFKDVDYQASCDNDRTYGMILKDLFLKESFDCNSEYRRIFSECENRLDLQDEIFLISDYARYIASCYDIEVQKRKRIENYSYLQKAGISPSIHLEVGECPLVLPIAVENRDKLRAHLMDNHIYCAIHWPFDDVQKDSRKFAQWCANHLISLPIDQRYGEEDMKYLLEVIKGYGRVLYAKNNNGRQSGRMEWHS